MKNYRINILISFFLAIILFNTKLIAGTGDWKIYRAYQNASIVAETPNMVFAVYDGSLLSYNPEDQEVRTYSSRDGLNDVDIQYMAYSPEANALILVYSNANIDIFVNENRVYNLSAIKDNLYIRNKIVNNLEMIDGYAYISTSFGIVVVDVAEKIIKGDYRLNMDVKSVCRKGDYLYAVTTDGIKKASVNSNLLDVENWKFAEDADFSDTPEGYQKIVVFKDKFVLMLWNHIFFQSDNGSFIHRHSDINKIAVLNDKLIMIAPDAVYFYSDFDTYTQIPLSVNDIDCKNKSDLYWVGESGSGLAGIKKADNSSSYELIASDIKVNSPKSNLNFSMIYTAGKLLVVGGGRDADRSNNPGTLMVYENGKWHNFDEKEISEKTGLPCLDFMSVAVDPLDANHYFVASWGEGLYEFKENQFVMLYSLTNSSLQSATTSSMERFVRVDGLTFDKNHNLYMVNGGVPNALSVFSAQNEWENYYINGISNSYPNRILIDSKNRKWLNIWRTDKAGMVLLDENNEQIGFSRNFVDQLGTDIQASAYLCMTEDQYGTVWVGTDNGPISFSVSNPDGVKNGVCFRNTVIDEYGLNNYILEKEKINAIAVDGGNRKWMGTKNSGIFVLEETTKGIVIENFNTENSYLLSNDVNSIAINNETGEVFIGTDKGLCSYFCGAITGKDGYEDVYAFPNPVRPAVNSRVTITGLMNNSSVKITDMAGSLIVEGQSLGGQFTWDCTNRSGEIVKAGIYLVFAATPTGDKGVVTKIMVIK